MTKEEFKSEYCISEQMAERLDRMVKHEIQQAISDHGAEQYRRILDEELNLPVPFGIEQPLSIVKIMRRYFNRPDIHDSDDLFIQEIIANHEAEKWKAYPCPEMLNGEDLYLITLPDKTVHTAYAMSFSALNVIAFRELPEPYKEK